MVNNRGSCIMGLLWARDTTPLCLAKHSVHGRLFERDVPARSDGSAIIVETTARDNADGVCRNIVGDFGISAALVSSSGQHNAQLYHSCFDARAI